MSPVPTKPDAPQSRKFRLRREKGKFSAYLALRGVERRRFFEQSPVLNRFVPASFSCQANSYRRRT